MVELRDIPGYEGLYAASSDGRIWAYEKVRNNRIYPARWLKPSLRGKAPDANYPSVVLCKAGKMRSFLVHVLVATLFVPKPTVCTQVNHKDGDKTNNHPSNLEWVTELENLFHAQTNWLSRKTSSRFFGVSFHKATRKWRSYIRLGHRQKSLGYYTTEVDAARAYNAYYAGDQSGRPLNQAVY